MSIEVNLRLMKTLDDAWNSRDWETFKKRHAEHVAVYWPGQEQPTRGRTSHYDEAVQFCKSFPDNRVENNPYLVLFGQGEWTCSVGILRGTHKGPMIGPSGQMIPATNKEFKLELCTVARWKNGETLEEKLFFDQPDMMRQLGLMPGNAKAPEVAVV